MSAVPLSAARILPCRKIEKMMARMGAAAATAMTMWNWLFSPEKSVSMISPM
jgi:hypothetical protein